MAIPITYTYVELHTCGNVRDSFKIVDECEITAKAYFKIKCVKPATDAIVIQNGTDIVFTAINYYTLTFTVYPKGCPQANLPIDLEELLVFPGTELTVVKGLNSITVSGVIPVGTKLRIYTNPNLLRYFKCIELLGYLGVSNVAEQTALISASDVATKIRYVPSTPAAQSLLPFIPYPPPVGPGSNPLLPGQYPTFTSVFPWRENIIPWFIEQPFPVHVVIPDDGQIITPDAPWGLDPFPAFPIPPFPTDSINGYMDSYEKLKSVPDSVIYYIGFDQKLILPREEAWTVFLTNFQDRGYSGPIGDPEWMIANYQKKVYMNALSLDKLQFYIPKIEQFVNNAFSAATTYGKPVTSSFQENLVLYFLRMHIGNQDYPEFVIKWFSDFITFVGIGDQSNPLRAQLLMYGNTTSPQIFEYFEDKNIEVISNADKSCIAYWWSQAGLSSKALVFECVHNIVAFSQFSNVIYSTIYAALHNINPLFGTLPGFPLYPNFLAEYAAAGTSNDKLNVVRECYRLTVPNSISFSFVNPKVPDANVIKARHSHQTLMITSASPVGPYTNPPLPFPPAQLATFNQAYNYFTYDPSKYNANFNTNLDNLVGLPVVTDVLAASVTSPLDKETVVDASTMPARPIVPIFAGPIMNPLNPTLNISSYAPFGFGYRRCAGEMLTYLITEKMFDVFSTVEFEERNDIVYPLISIAPFKRVEDNIFVKQL